MAVICADRRSSCKAAQPLNREWVTALIFISNKSWVLLRLWWFKEGVFLRSVVLGPHLGRIDYEADNQWTDKSLTGLKWVNHFDKHTVTCVKDVYQMLVLNKREGDKLAGLLGYYKTHSSFTIYLPHLYQNTLAPDFRFLAYKTGK